nr:hypothetical protein [Tanacetum cinerariifolium]
MSEIRELQAADRRRQTVISELLRIDHRRSIEISELRTALQGHVMALQGQVTALQAQAPNELPVFPNGVKEWSPSFLNVNRYLSKAPKELPVFPNGVKEWSPSFISATALPFKGTEGVASLYQWNTTNTNNSKNQRGTGLGQKTTCYECGVQGHFRRECPKLKNNNNHGNQGGRNNAPARVYAVGHAGADPDANVMTADERIIGLNTILRGCTLNLLNNPFNIDLMLVELGCFDDIIGMDWLAKYQAVIVCAEKIVRIPWRNETLIIHGDGNNQGNATRLSIISYSKIEKYVKKGFPIFLAHITMKDVEDKSEKKRLEDVPIV